MADYNYDAIKALVQAAGGFGNTPPPPNDNQFSSPVTFTGTGTLDLGAIQDEVLALKFDEQADLQFGGSSFKPDKEKSATEKTNVDKDGTNVFGGAGSAFLGGNRVVINANKDMAMMFGQEGVAIASPERVHIDAGKGITLFSAEELFLGIPGRGLTIDPKKSTDRPKPSSVGAPTNDEIYEPVVLGLKLINLIEDLITIIETSEVAAPTGNGKFQPSTVASLELLKLRLPECISTYAFVDGISHQQVDGDRLKTVEAAKKKAKDFVPQRSFTFNVTGTAEFSQGGPGGPPPNPVTSPYAELPGFYETPSTDPYGDSSTL